MSSRADLNRTPERFGKSYPDFSVVREVFDFQTIDGRPLRSEPPGI